MQIRHGGSVWFVRPGSPVRSHRLIIIMLISDVWRIVESAKASGVDLIPDLAHIVLI